MPTPDQEQQELKTCRTLRLVDDESGEQVAWLTLPYGEWRMRKERARLYDRLVIECVSPINMLSGEPSR